MTATFTALATNSDTTNQTGPYTTATITPTANQPVLVAVVTTVAISPTPVVTVSGCGLTWTQLDATVAGARTATLFLGIGSAPTTGALSIAGDGTTTTTSCLWQVAQAAGVDTTTANGVVQTVNAKPASSASISVPFGAAVAAGNGTYGAVGTAVQEAPVPGSGWSALGSTTQSAPTSGLLGEGTSAAQQNITASWTTAATAFVVGVELASLLTAASGTGGITLGGSTSSPTIFAASSGSVALAGAPTATTAPAGSAGSITLGGTAAGMAPAQGSITLGGTATAAATQPPARLPGTAVLTSTGIGVAALVADGTSTAALATAGIGTAPLTGSPGTATIQTA